MINDASEDAVRDALAHIRGSEALFADAFASALGQSGGDPAAACMKLAVDVRTNVELNDAIVHLHLVYFLQQLGRRALETGSAGQAAFN